MNCSKLLLDDTALALEIAVGVEMRMVDSTVMAATCCCGEWRRTDLRVSSCGLLTEVGERQGDDDDDGCLDGEIDLATTPFTCHDHEEQRRGAWMSKDVNNSSRQDVLVLVERGIILPTVFQGVS